MDMSVSCRKHWGDTKAEDVIPQINNPIIETQPNNDYIGILANLMSDISERCYHAGWMDQLEYFLWGVCQGEHSPDYGHGFVTIQDVAALKWLSNICGGWIYFDEENGETFIRLSDWMNEYKRVTSG